MTHKSSSGARVFLVGAGPGDPDLITLRATACLAQADLVLYDYLVNPAMLRHAPSSAELVCLGQSHSGRSIPQNEVNQRMIAAAQAGKTVVRLKSGDPGIFGRGAEEAEVLARAGIPYEVVPGVTAASAIFSHVGIPLTHRDAASAVAFVTGHQRGDLGNHPSDCLDHQQLGNFPGTLVFYMGIGSANQWSEALIRGGRSPDTPVAIVRRITWPDQQSVICTLGTVADVIERDKIRAPALVIVGDTVTR